MRHMSCYNGLASTTCLQNVRSLRALCNYSDPYGICLWIFRHITESQNVCWYHMHDEELYRVW